MQSSDRHFRKKLFYLIIFIAVITGILIVSLIWLQKSVENHYTIQQQQPAESIELLYSPDEEYKVIGKAGALSLTHRTMIPDLQTTNNVSN
jgi:hypothetical protein